MRINIKNACLFLFALISTGCSTPYMVNRTRDGADIFTASFGTGAGIKARVGPCSTGIFVNGDAFGFRGGALFNVKADAQFKPYDFTSIIPKPGMLPIFVEERFKLNGEPELRHKNFKAKGIFPFWVYKANGWEYYSQVEFAVAIGGSFRLGFNIGELLDFILGWSTIDIYGDDIGIIIEENKPLNEENSGDGVLLPQI